MRKTYVVLILLFLVIGCVASSTPTVEFAATPTQVVHDAIATMTAEAASPTVTASPRPLLTPTAIIHVVQPGDTLWSIGAQYGVTADALCSFNKLADCDLISPGQELTIPIGEVPSPTPTIPPFPPPTPTSIPTSTSTLTPSPSPTVSPTPLGEQAQVVTVVDGDTIDVQIGGQAFRVRYIGINTPETGQPCAVEATNHNAQLVMGKVVTLVKDVSETDRYGRLLRYVYVGDMFVNAELVRQGYANAASYPPDVAYADLFVQLEAEARTAGRGCWAAPLTPTSGGAWNCSGNIYNCSDFSSCAQVMSYWNACPGDPSRLDGDNDGIPCEGLCQ